MLLLLLLLLLLPPPSPALALPKVVPRTCCMLEELAGLEAGAGAETEAAGLFEAGVTAACALADRRLRFKPELFGSEPFSKTPAR